MFINTNMSNIFKLPYSRDNETDQWLVDWIVFFCSPLSFCHKLSAFHMLFVCLLFFLSILQFLAKVDTDLELNEAKETHKKKETNQSRLILNEREISIDFLLINT